MTLPTNGYCIDIEADNFYLLSKEMWYINLKSLDKARELELWPFREGAEHCKQQLLEWHQSFGECPLVVSYNGLGYDSWMLWKFFGISFHLGKQGSDWFGDYPCQYVDLYVLSMFLSPDRPKHSLASWGEALGNYKQDFSDFTQYSETMREYCKQDVSVTLSVFKELWSWAARIYPEWITPAYKMTQKDYWLYQAQAYTGVKFDQESGKALVERITQMMEEVEAEVLPQLPPRKLKKGEQQEYTMPAKPYLKSGDLSSHMLSFIEKHKGEVVSENVYRFYGKNYKIQSKLLLDIKLPMEVKDGDEIKDWFISQGWRPLYWNVQKDAKGKPIRDTKGEVIKTSPKIQEMGNICPNLLELDGELPKRVVRFLSLRNRRSVLQGWLANWRLAFDGRLSGEITGYTPTYRVKGKTVVNCPKASPDVLLGCEFRDLFRAEEEMLYVGADASSLENRTMASLTYKFDGGVFAKLTLEGDPHSKAAKSLFPKKLERFDITAKDFNKDDPEFKPFRAKGKTANYLLGYGGSYKKLGKSIGLSEAEAKVAFDNYWEEMKGLKGLKDALEQHWEHKGERKYVTAVDGRRFQARSKHLLINLLGQGLGACVMQYTACLMDSWMGWMQLDDLGRPYYSYKGRIAKRVGAQHDEQSWEAHPEIAEEIGQLVVKGIRQAGIALKLNVALDGEGKVGLSWKDVH